MADEPTWLTIARVELGVHETKGPGTTPRVAEYLAACKGGQGAADETPWCSAFVNWVVAHAGMTGTKKLNARSWKAWGKKTPPRVGAIAVLWRDSKASAKGHVAFLERWNDTSLFLLGGNQNDEVCVRAYPRSRLLELRWPEGVS